MPDNGKQTPQSLDDEKLFDDIDEIESEEDEAALDEAIKQEEAEQSAQEAEEAVDPFEALQTENAELKDKLLRNLAEMQNLRKRA